MNDLPDIIHTNVVTDNWDKFWSEAQENRDNMLPTDVLILSKPFAGNSDDEVQLIKMMQACKLGEDAYKVMQVDEQTVVSWHALRDKLNIKTLILLGVSPQEIGVSAQLMPHQVSRFNNCNWIVTSSLPELRVQNDIKTHLWNYGLKPIFIDKVYG